jgi:heavy metal sensor kinase
MRSFRSKLVAAVTAVMAMVLLTLGAMTYSLTSESLRGDIDLLIRDKAFQLSRAGDAASEFRGTFVTEAQMEAGNRQVLAQFHNIDGEPRYKSARLPEPLPLTSTARTAVEHRSRWFVETVRLSDGTPIRVATVGITQYRPDTRDHVVIGYAQAGVTFADVNQRLNHLLRWLIAGAAMGLAAGGLLTWFMSGYWLRAVDEMAASASHAQNDNLLQERLYAPPNAPELARLAASFNGLLDRVSALHRSQQQFVADAAHELHTPLAALRAEIDVALRRQRSGTEYEHTLHLNRLELERLGSLVENLLALARLEARPSNQNFASANLASICRDVVEGLAPLAAAQKITVKLEVPNEVVIRGDTISLERSVRNLVENALHHTPSEEEILVRVSNGNGEAVVEVVDRGVGIPPEHLPRLFDRFYRVDTARNRAQGGAGLGLSIVKAITEAHGGTAQVQSSPGHGSTFTLRFPLHGVAKNDSDKTTDEHG